MRNKRLLADFALATCSLIWGTTFVVIKDALNDISVIAYLAIRFGLAAILMAAIYWRTVRRLDRATIWAGAQIGLFMFGGYIFQIGGLKFTTPSKAAFITGMFVVFVPIFLAVFGRRRIVAWIWAGAAAAIAGLYFLTVPPQGFGGLNKGDPIVFGCAILFALHLIFIGRYVGTHSVAALSFLQVATTGVLALIVLPISAAAGWEQPRVILTGYVIFTILLTALGATVLCFSLQTWAQQHASPSHAAILMTLEPVFAAVTSLVLGHDHFNARFATGAILILAGILLAELKGSAPAASESLAPVTPSAE
jgi:drug/metabolite transporter (DMT)-like permease